MVGGGGSSVPCNMENQGGGGGVKFPLWWGIDIFWNHTI